jgi:hypothetical protein
MDSTTELSDEQIRERRNQQARFYYYNNRERVLQRQKEKWANRTPQQIQEEKDYQVWYYEEHRKKILEARKGKPSPPRVKKPADKPPSLKKKKAHPPKMYFQYEDSHEFQSKNNPLSTPKSLYQKKKLDTICPLGQYQPPEPPANPFLVTF